MLRPNNTRAPELQRIRVLRTRTVFVLFCFFFLLRNNILLLFLKKSPCFCFGWRPRKLLTAPSFSPHHRKTGTLPPGAFSRLQCYFLCQRGRTRPSLVFRSALILSRRSILCEAARARQIGKQTEQATKILTSARFKHFNDRKP